MKIRIAIFASGSGSNAENLINYFKNSKIVQVSLILSNRKDAYVLTRAQQYDIPSIVFNKEELGNGFVLDILGNYKIDFIVLAGFLLKIPSSIINAYRGKILNIHPALLPSYGGKGMYGDNVHQAVLVSKEKISGITIHQVNDNYDEGDIIFQATCEVGNNDTVESLAGKIHQLEYEYFPRIIDGYLKKMLK